MDPHTRKGVGVYLRLAPMYGILSCMSTLIMDPVEVEKIVSSSDVSARGVQRQVWFVGDVVVKKDSNSGETNRKEHELAQDFKPHTFDVNGEEWTIRAPQTAMVGRYLIMERIDKPHFADYGVREKFECDRCTTWEQKLGCWTSVTYWKHAVECPKYVINQKCHYEATTALNLRDMHTGNYILDFDTRTMWIIDLGFC